MLRIGMISDTHGYLDPAVFHHFKNVDEVWHAGDFGANVLEQLRAFKPLRGVWGNIDGPDIRQAMPEIAEFMVEEVSVLMIHIGGYPKKYSPQAKAALALTKPQLFISGHSHVLKIIYDEQIHCLHMNSGAAGRQGWHQKRTIIRFAIDGATMKDCEVIELGMRGQV